MNRNIEKQADVMLSNAYHRLLPFLLYLRCKLRITFARRCFRDDLTVSYVNNLISLILLVNTVHFSMTEKCSGGKVYWTIYAAIFSNMV